MEDDGHGVHYTALTRGTPVLASDGIVIEIPGGDLRFVDAPEVARTAERAVTLNITAAEADELPPPERAPPSFRPRQSKGRLGRFLGGGWRRQ